MYWARGPQSNPDHLGAQLEAFGADQETVAAALEQEAAADVCEVHEDNMLALFAFLSLQTQWRIIASGMAPAVYQGLDYAAVPVVLDALAIPRKSRPALFADLQVMEQAALLQLNRKGEE